MSGHTVDTNRTEIGLDPFVPLPHVVDVRQRMAENQREHEEAQQRMAAFIKAWGYGL